jgi:hypothetical protein
MPNGTSFRPFLTGTSNRRKIEHALFLRRLPVRNSRCDWSKRVLQPVECKHGVAGRFSCEKTVEAHTFVTHYVILT